MADTIDESSSKPLIEGPSKKLKDKLNQKPDKVPIQWSYQPQVKAKESRPEVGMGGSIAPDPSMRAQGLMQRALSAEELMTMANALQAQIEAASQTPSSLEPALERETNVPYWLRAYAQNQGIDQGTPQPPQMTREESLMNNKYMNDSERQKIREYTKPK